METFVELLPSSSEPNRCVRTIVVWKQQWSNTSNMYTVYALRENHSGMETKYVPLGLLPTAFCCVRTIVVWKRDYCFAVSLRFHELRENHSGMETLLKLIDQLNAKTLRENHSGMETFVRLTARMPAELPLRENHSGMETYPMFSMVTRIPNVA